MGAFHIKNENGWLNIYSGVLKHTDKVEILNAAQQMFQT